LEPGFTLIELLLVIAIIAILAGLLFPIFARTRSRSEGVYCMDNLRQITAAWVMYSSDNNGTFAVNEENATDADGPMPGWVKGSLDYSGSPDNTNLSYLVDSHDALLGSFLQTPAVFKCPADASKTFGQTGAPRVRSFSMNQAVGPGPYGGSAGQGSLLPSPAYRVYTKESDILHPTPSDLWLLTEEDPDSINDGGFSFFMPPSAILTRWDDMPSRCHADTCPFSFADGHVEIHRWQWPQIIPPATYNRELIKPLYALGDPDILWVARHTSALANGQPLPY
jgi:prepilin-type N-terminal cleavage/methylation domain-containing protein/prepilin-type processing-associated H-X9-DG protein